MRSKHTQSLRSNARRAFTLLEILVVLAIIGLLAGLLITNVDKIFDQSKEATTKLFVNDTMRIALNAYKFSMGDYPSTADGLQALVAAPAAHADKWRGPYITENKLPLDPWNESYQYAYPGTHNKGSYDVWSKGKDHQSGTEDDIGNWEGPSAEAPK